MKTIFALATALIAGSALAQTPRHMIDFNADSLLNGYLSFSRSKAKGQESDRNTNLNLDLNYAYALPAMPQIQVGGQFKYQKGVFAGRGDSEDYIADVGAWWNHRETLNDTLYVKAMLGLGWVNNYNSSSPRKDEVLRSTFAIGHRFPLTRWGMNHVTYSPEVALQNVNSTTGSALEYRQDIQLRFLQFSVLF